VESPVSPSKPQNAKATETIEEAGFCLHLHPMTIHRIQALEDATILEVSTPQLTDVVRLEMITDGQNN